MPSHWEAFPSVVPSCLAGFNLVFCGKFYLKTVMKRTINAPKSEIWARMKRMQDANKLWILKEKLQRKNEIKQVWLHHNKPWFSSVQFISVTQLCPTLCDPMNCSTPGLLSITISRSSLKLTSIESVMPFSHLILCCPLLLLPPIPPSIRVFSSKTTLHVRWPKYWSFSFSIIPSKEHQSWFLLEWTGWISLQSKGLSRVFSNTTVQKHQFFGAQL